MNKQQLKIGIIGAGPAGLAAGYELKKRGFENFTIIDKQDAAGGTWHSHSYPGLACDLWAHSYTFSYRPNPDWSANFVDQPEIEAYLQQCTREFGLEPHLLLNTQIDAATLQPDNSWLLTSNDGQQHRFDIVINAMGGQHTPVYPEVPGRDGFAGEAWHSTHWNHDIALENKRVVIVGSAAAAVQIVPKVAARAKHLTVLQRSPNWIMPRNYQPYSATMKTLFKKVPGLMRFWRWGQLAVMGAVLEGVTLKHKRMQQFEARAKKFIDEVITDPELNAAVTPDFHYGCKRGLVSDDFYPALMQDNVELIADSLAEVKAHSIVTSEGREIDADIIIYCTGYRVLDYDRIAVTGRDNRVLADEMARAPVAYRGIAAPGFANYFFAVGPNGLPINTSYFTSAELNAQSISNLLEAMIEKNIRAIEVTQDATDSYNAKLAPLFGKYSWGDSNCDSYYRTASGHAPFLFPGGIKDYAKEHAECSLQDFATTSA